MAVRWLTRLFFFNDTATTEIYTLSLHDALPISPAAGCSAAGRTAPAPAPRRPRTRPARRRGGRRSEEHTSELQSRSDLVCRLLLEKKNPRLRPHHSRGYHAGDGQLDRFRGARDA